MRSSYWSSDVCSSDLAWRSSCMNPASSSVMATPDARSASIVVGPLSGGVMPSRLLAGRRLGDGAVVLLELADRLGDVALVLEQDVDGGLGRLGVDAVDAEEQQGAGPVARLGDRKSTRLHSSTYCAPRMPSSA